MKWPFLRPSKRSGLSPIDRRVPPRHGRGLILALLIFSALAAMAPASSLGQERLPSEMESIIRDPLYGPSRWGILVSDLSSGETIYELDADKLFAPASVAKLFSMAAGLDAFGAQYRFETPIYRRGPINEQGDIEGDLILLARGDLTLGGRTDEEGRIAYSHKDHTYARTDGSIAAVLTEPNPLAGLDCLAKQVASSGIKRVQGEVIVDDRLFETSRGLHGFIRTPITINDNLIDIVIKPTKPGEFALVDWRPRTFAYSVDIQVMTVNPTEERHIEITPKGPHRILVRGQIPAREKPSVSVFRIEDPPSFARALLIEALQRAGVSVDAPPLGINPSHLLPEEAAYPSLPIVALFESPPYSETLKLILKVSHNLGADLTPLLLAARKGKRSFEEGMTSIRTFLEGVGLDVKTISLSDGMGGERGDQVTPRATIRLLRYMASHPDFKAYYEAQPVLGEDGTLAHAISPDSPARGQVHAKTGTIPIDDLLNERPFLLVKALAGYMTASSGRRLAFALFVNSIPITDAGEVARVGNHLVRLAEAIHRSL